MNHMGEVYQPDKQYTVFLWCFRDLGRRPSSPRNTGREARGVWACVGEWNTCNEDGVRAGPQYVSK